MDSTIWHVLWTTQGGRLPDDPHGDCGQLAELYAPLLVAGLVAVSQPFRSCYRERNEPALSLAREDAAALLLFESRWAGKGPHVWGKGFWTAEILDPEATVQIADFIADLLKTGIGSSARMSS
jgi:hypothetical protein